MKLRDKKDFFYQLHDVVVNQKYDKNLPYSFHLKLVETQAYKFIHHIPVDEPYYSSVFIGLYGHDSMEDARLTYNNIKDTFGEFTAEIIYLCTENKGRTRNDRKDENWYKELSTNKYAVFVKLCDIIANSLYSLTSGSSMFEKYKNEYYKKVKPFLYVEYGGIYGDMFDYLEKIYEI